jgi:AAA domain
MNEFLHRLHKEDRVLLVGDKRQHEAVEAGRPFGNCWKQQCKPLGSMRFCGRRIRGLEKLWSNSPAATCGELDDISSTQLKLSFCACRVPGLYQSL